MYVEKVGGVPEEETIMALPNLLNLSPGEEVLYAHEIRVRRFEEAKLEGKLELVSKQLARRFGVLPPEVTARLRIATTADLEEMGLRILSASTLDDVLGKPKRKRK